MDGRVRVRPNGDFVSGDPQSEPDTQDSPPEPASGGPDRPPGSRADRHAAKLSNRRYRGKAARSSTSRSGAVPEALNPECSRSSRRTSISRRVEPSSFSDAPEARFGLRLRAVRRPGSRARPPGVGHLPRGVLVRRVGVGNALPPRIDRPKSGVLALAALQGPLKLLGPRGGLGTNRRVLLEGDFDVDKERKRRFDQRGHLCPASLRLPLTEHILAQPL